MISVSVFENNWDINVLTRQICATERVRCREVYDFVMTLVMGIRYGFLTSCEVIDDV